MPPGSVPIVLVAAGMEGEPSAGEYVTPEGAIVWVRRSDAGWWSCVVLEVGRRAVTAQRLTPVLWAGLQPRRARSA